MSRRKDDGWMTGEVVSRADGTIRNGAMGERINPHPSSLLKGLVGILIIFWITPSSFWIVLIDR